jgi:cob(I)alamin adenosyltransferase
MYNRRVAKTHPRIEACGCVDELNAVLGLARAAASHDRVREHLLAIQNDLVALMGEVATLAEDLPRYRQDGYPTVSPEMTGKLDKIIESIEAQPVAPTGWATPGSTLSSAALEIARTTCRRAERRVCVLRDAGQLTNPEVLVYLNRLSDALWLLARWVEGRPK